MKTSAKLGLSAVGIAAVVAGTALLGKGPKTTTAPAPAPGVAAPSANAHPSTVDLLNESSVNIMAFIAFGADSVVLPASIQACNVDAGLTCQFMLPAHGLVSLPLDGKYLNATISFGAPVSCGSTKAEVNVNNPKWYDVTDISLVDGYSNGMLMDIEDASGKHRLGPVASGSGNQNMDGVFPLGCDICVQRQHPPCGMQPGPMNGDGCKKGTQYNPTPPCQYQGPTMGGGSKVVVKHIGV
jgi:hypothetical protein